MKNNFNFITIKKSSRRGSGEISLRNGILSIGKNTGLQGRICEISYDLDHNLIKFVENEAEYKIRQSFSVAALKAMPNGTYILVGNDTFKLLTKTERN